MEEWALPIKHLADFTATAQQTLNLCSHEMEAALDSALLSESPAQAASAASGARVRKDHWKGMTATEKQAILDEQFRQARARFLARVCDASIAAA